MRLPRRFTGVSLRTASKTALPTQFHYGNRLLRSHPRRRPTAENSMRLRNVFERPKRNCAVPATRKCSAFERTSGGAGERRRAAEWKLGRSEGRATSSQTESEEVRCRKLSTIPISSHLHFCQPSAVVSGDQMLRSGAVRVRGADTLPAQESEEHLLVSGAEATITRARGSHTTLLPLDSRLCSEPLHNKAKTFAIRSLPSLSPDPHPTIPKTQASSANTQRPNS